MVYLCSLMHSKLFAKSKSIRLSDQNNGCASVVFVQVSVILFTHLNQSESFLLTCKEYFFKHYTLFCGNIVSLFCFMGIECYDHELALRSNNNLQRNCSCYIQIKILHGVLGFKTSLCDCSGIWFQPSKSNF